MSYCSEYCDIILEQLEPLSKNINFVFAHESSIKDVPISQTIAAISVKKCVVSARSTSIDDNVKVNTKNRNISVTVGINLYVPYKMGAKGCVSVFDDIFDRLVVLNDYELRESRFLSTSYSRDTQCLVAKTEFVFETVNGWSEIIEGPEFLG